MTRHVASMPPDYFAGLYAANPDPWQFTSSGYERAKYEATLASLTRPTYASGLEIGCSIGVFTLQLAQRCDALVALDVADAALDAARERCAGQPRVRFAKAVVPADWPEGRFDLIVLSEVVYFLTPADIAVLVERVVASMMPGGDLVLVHWLGETHYPVDGDEAAQTVIALSADAFDLVRQDRTPSYRLDVLRARPAQPA